MFHLHCTLPSLIATPLAMVSMGWLFLSACDVDIINARKSLDAEASFDVFKTHVYPVFKARGCNSCHKAGAHPFAAVKIPDAYDKATEYVDFSDIENSPLVVESKNPNHKHGCSEASGECKENAEQLTEALQKWQASHISAEKDSLDFTIEKDADQGETGDYNDHKLEFPLNHLIDTDETGNVTLEVAVSKSTAAKLLILKNFKITTTDKPIYFKGLQPKRNGKLSADATKRRVCALVETSNKEILTQFSEINFTFEEGDSKPNKIAIGLIDLRIATSSDKCGDKSIGDVDLSQAKIDFETKSSGIGRIIQRSCVANCHTANKPPRLDLTVFDNLYDQRQDLIRRVECGAAVTNRQECMPPSTPNFFAKSQLVNWLTNLPQ